MIDPTKTYYFLHIPKTAGTTFKSILQQEFQPEQICYADNLLSLSKNWYSDHRLFMGHYFYGIDKIIGKKPVYLTFLRDPVKRFISHYHYLKRLEWHPFHQYTGSIESFMDSPVIQEHCANVQTRMLAATVNKNVKEHWDKPALLLLRELEKSVMRSDKSKLELAIRRLNGFWFVGNADQFEESILKIGLKSNGKRLNQGNYDDLDQSIKARIAELNALDIQLVQGFHMEQQKTESV